MEIRAQLFESDERPGSFTEFTWFEPGQEAALADDRLTRLNDELNAAAEARTGALELSTRHCLTLETVRHSGRARREERIEPDRVEQA